MFRPENIKRRADAVEELAGGAAAAAMSEARLLLKRTGNLDRLMSRTHSMGRGTDGGEGHPNERAIFFEIDKHTRRKVSDFAALLNGLKAAAMIPQLFEGIDIRSPLLIGIVRTNDCEGGKFPANMNEELDWFFDNFDQKQASKGLYEPTRSVSPSYDQACGVAENLVNRLHAFKHDMCSHLQIPSSSWNYINTREDQKDKYLIELPIQIYNRCSHLFHVVGKRGKNEKQVNKCTHPHVLAIVQELEHAIDVKDKCKSQGMALIFKKFDDMRSIWMAAKVATAMLDALGSMALLAMEPGFVRPQIMDCPPSEKPGIEVINGRHPCVTMTHSGGDFVPNDLALGRRFFAPERAEGAGTRHNDACMLLLSGPNMGGKSTLLRQTCLMSILAQMGCYVPAERCALTPVDKIFTRLGASDRILCGKSTFFVELAETAAAVRGATRRSLAIMDELGR